VDRQHAPVGEPVRQPGPPGRRVAVGGGFIDNPRQIEVRSNLGGSAKAVLTS
jgi:hypothetical protein